MNAAARCSAGTSQGPTRLVSLMIASELSWVTLVGRLLRTGAGAVLCGMGRQVGGDRHQVGVRLRGVRRLEPVVELVEVEAPLARGLAQQLGHPVPVGVGDAQPSPRRALREPSSGRSSGPAMPPA